MSGKLWALTEGKDALWSRCGLRNSKLSSGCFFFISHTPFSLRNSVDTAKLGVTLGFSYSQKSGGTC